MKKIPIKYDIFSKSNIITKYSETELSPPHFKFSDGVQGWVDEREMYIKIDMINGQANGFPIGWLCKGPVLVFENDEDAIEFKLRWL